MQRAGDPASGSGRKRCCNILVTFTSLCATVLPAIVASEVVCVCVCVEFLPRVVSEVQS
mgnify:CR=1 FL=1